MKLKILTNEHLLKKPESWNYMTVLKTYENGTQSKIAMTPEEYKIKDFQNKLVKKYGISEKEFDELENLYQDHHNREHDEDESY